MPLPDFLISHFLLEAAATPLMPGEAASILQILLRFHSCNAMSMALLTDRHWSLVSVMDTSSDPSADGDTSTQ